MKVKQLLELAEPLIEEIGIFQPGDLSFLLDHNADVDNVALKIFFAQCVKSIKLRKGIDEIKSIKSRFQSL